MDIVAAGWDVECENRTSSYRLMDGNDYFDKNTTVLQEQPMFTTNVTYDQEVDDGLGLQHSIGISTMYKSTPGTNGTLQWRNCTLREALVRYPISIANTTVTLRNMSATANQTELFVRRGYESAGMSSKLIFYLHTSRWKHSPPVWLVCALCQKSTFGRTESSSRPEGTSAVPRDACESDRGEDLSAP